MKIKIINPNTSVAMTEAVRKTATKYASPGTQIIAVNPSTGPAYIGGYYDEAMCASGMLAEVVKGAEEGVDGFVVAAYVDPFCSRREKSPRYPSWGSGKLRC